MLRFPAREEWNALCAEVQYVRFREMIAGTGTSDVAVHMGGLGQMPSTHVLSSWAHLCHPFPFTEMREVAYRNFDMTVRSIHLDPCRHSYWLSATGRTMTSPATMQTEPMLTVQP